jgi:hypothetical protein
MSGKTPRNWNWLATIVAAIISAIATIVAVLIANGTGAITIPGTASSTVTITPSPRPTVTVTAAAGSSAGVVNCPPGQGCTIKDLAAPLPQPGAGGNGLALDQGKVAIGGYGDLEYELTSTSNEPELVVQDARAYSLDVSSPSATKQECQAATNQDPRATPIFSLHPGLLICVQTSDGGVALLDQTAPLTGSSKILHIRDTYWPGTNG